MAFAESGKYREAAELQRAMIEEVASARRMDLVPVLRADLALYEQRRPCRAPWRDDDPIFSPVPQAPSPLE